MSDTKKEFLEAYDRRTKMRDMSNYAGGMTDDEVVMLLADQKGNKKHGDQSKRLRERWVRSEEFVPMILPVDLCYPVRVPSGRTKSYSTGPIVIENNFRNVEQSDAGVKNGFIPPWLVIDGQHRWYQAKLSGQKTIRAVVGIDAVGKIHAAMLRRAAERKKYKKKTEIIATDAITGRVAPLRDFIAEGIQEMERAAARKKRK